MELQSNKDVFCPAKQRLECVQEIRKLVSKFRNVEGAVRGREKKPRGLLGLWKVGGGGDLVAASRNEQRQEQQRASLNDAVSM